MDNPTVSTVASAEYRGWCRGFSVRAMEPEAAPSHPQLWPLLYPCFSSPRLCSEREPCTWPHICWSDWASAVSPQGPASSLLLPSTAPGHTEPPAESRWAQAGPFGLHSVLEHSAKPITSPAPGWMREIHSESCMWPWEVTDAAGGVNSRTLQPPWSLSRLYNHHPPLLGWRLNPSVPESSI